MRNLAGMLSWLFCLFCLTYSVSANAEEVKTVDTYVGPIQFSDQTITQETAKKLHRRIDLQRASQLALWALPAVSFYQLHKSWYANLGADPKKTQIGLFSGYDGVYPFLTANVTTPYTISSLDLEKTGPVVVKIPAGGVYGVANNAWQEPIKEINSGKAETILFVGPGQEYPKEFDGEVIQSETFKIFYFYRVVGTGPEIEELKSKVQAYRLADAVNPPKTEIVKYDPKPGDKVSMNAPPEDMGYWDLLNDFVQTEPMADRDRFFYAWMRDLGIEKGKPFKPTPYQKEILLEGLKVGLAMAQTTSFNKRFPTALYGKDSGWEDVMAGMNPKINLENYSMFNERVSYTYEAATTSEGMTKRVEGQGSAYLGTYYDADGNALRGENSYKLRIEPDPPAKNFWSITVYDAKNRSVIRNENRKSDLSSRMKDLESNSDGSVELYFGPKAPKGKDANWVQTNPGESFFIYLRLYGPLKPFMEQTWPMNKVERVN